CARLGVASQRLGVAWQPSSQRDHDVLGVGRPRLQPLVPGLHVLELGPLDLERVPAVYEATGRNVAHGEMLAADILAALQLLLEAAPQFATVDRGLFDRRHVALVGWRADQAPE